MFCLMLEYQFDFLANSFVVPSVLVWGLGSSRNNVHTYEKYDIYPS